MTPTLTQQVWQTMIVIQTGQTQHRCVFRVWDGGSSIGGDHRLIHNCFFVFHPALNPNSLNTAVRRFTTVG